MFEISSGEEKLWLELCLVLDPNSPGIKLVEMQISEGLGFF